MSLFNWFSRKSSTGMTAASDSGPRSARSRPAAAERPTPDPVNRSETRKAKRHARREQLFIAVREAMTRSGVLASTYKFKVLSLDQIGNQFLVMMDIAPELGRQSDKLESIEATVAQTAKARFEITVTAVYWRAEAKTLARDAGTAKAAMKPAAPGLAKPAAVASGTASTAPAKKAAPRYDPIQEDEVAAFKQALAAAASGPTTVDASGKTRSGPHSYTLLTGFEDTEMPESAAVPALSSTQYGDLN